MSHIQQQSAPGKPRAIETVFKGYRFRSRLEARWGVFFETLGLEWTYEPEGFDLDGIWYLPDFQVKTPQGEDIWYEVKPRGVDEDGKFSRFAKSFFESPRAEILSGDPVEVIEQAEICPRCGWISLPRKYRHSEIREVHVAGGENFKEYAMACHPCDMETPGGGGHPIEPGFLGLAIYPHKGWAVTTLTAWRYRFNNRIKPAAAAARQARFEHGETPR